MISPVTCAVIGQKRYSPIPLLHRAEKKRMVSHNDSDTEDENGTESNEEDSTENEAEVVPEKEDESTPGGRMNSSPHRNRRSSAPATSALLDSPAANTRQSRNLAAARTILSPSPHSQGTIRTRSKAAGVVEPAVVLRRRKPSNKNPSGAKKATTRTPSKRKPASNSQGNNVCAPTKRIKQTKRQKAFVLSSDKRKPDPLMMKRVAFDVTDNGDGESLLKHFGGLSNISSCLVNGKYLFGTIVGLSKDKRSPICYDVEWEDTRLRITPVELPCIINGIELSKTIRKGNRSSMPATNTTSSPSTKSRIAELFGEEMMNALLEIQEGEEGIPEPSDDESDEQEDDQELTLFEEAPVDEGADFFMDSMRQYTALGADDPPWNPEPPSDEGRDQVFRWSSEESLSPPPNISKRGESQVKPERQGWFSSPILSFLAFIPFSMFKSITIYSNAYAHAVMEKSEKRTICGARWPADITINEMMKFFGLLFSMVLRPTPGSPYTSCWNDPGWHPYTIHLSLRRFQQIRSVLHFNLTHLGKPNENWDALYKVRPLLNCMKLTFPLFLQLGDNFALDEASVSSRSRYGSDLIFYNPTKPGGKYHFRFYLLCCSTSYVCIRLRMHTRNQSDFGDGFLNNEKNKASKDTSQRKSSEGEESIVGSCSDGSDDSTRNEPTSITNSSQPVKKMVSLVLDMCKPLFGTGSCVNMDNYYTSPEVAVALGKRDVYIRGTCRTNRLGFPAAVRFTNTEATKQGRGQMKKVVDVRNNLVAYGWVDGNPVHFLTSADGSKTTEVKRRIGKKIEKIKAPIAIRNYNKYMHAVDRHDQLRETFSLSKRHGFKKYYHKLAMGLLDMAAVNAWLHYRMVNKEECEKKTARYNFMKSLAESLLRTNWNEFSYTQSARENENIFKLLVNGESASNSNMPIVMQETLVGAASLVNGNDPRCHPLSVGNLLGDRRKKRTGLCCQVCAFEGRGKGKVRSVVICLCHRIRLCTVTRVSNDEEDITKTMDNSWRAPEGTSCWIKAHTFYIPKGLFSDNVPEITAEEVARLEEGKKIKFQSVRTGSELYRKKALASGTEGRLKKRVRKRGRKKNVAATTDEGRNDEDEEEDEVEEGDSESEEDITSFKTAQSEEQPNVPVEILAVHDDEDFDDAGLVTDRAWL